MVKVYIVIPVYNEAGNIGPVIRSLAALSQERALDLHIIAVNDGSHDSSVAEIESLASSISLQLIHHQTNQGIPKTFFDGFSAAASQATADDVIVMMEGDGTSDISLIPSMVAKIMSGADVVIASRVIPGGSFKRFPWFRKLGSLIVNYFVRMFARVSGVSDYTIFFRAYRARCIQQVIDRYQENFIVTRSFAANLEVLLKIQPYIHRVAEVPLVYDYGLKKGKSKMNLFKTLSEYAKLLWSLKKQQ